MAEGFMLKWHVLKLNSTGVWAKNQRINGSITHTWDLSPSLFRISKLFLLQAKLKLSVKKLGSPISPNLVLEKDLTIYGHGCHLVHVTYIIWTNCSPNHKGSEWNMTAVSSILGADAWKYKPEWLWQRSNNDLDLWFSCIHTVNYLYQPVLRL